MQTAERCWSSGKTPVGDIRGHEEMGGLGSVALDQGVETGLSFVINRWTGELAQPGTVKRPRRPEERHRPSRTREKWTTRSQVDRVGPVPLPRTLCLCPGPFW